MSSRCPQLLPGTTVAPHVAARDRAGRDARTLDHRGAVSAVTSTGQVSRCSRDTNVVLEDILRLDSDKVAPGMPSRHGRTTPFTDDFWNVRHICTADSNGRGRVAPRATPPDSGSTVTVAAAALAIGIGSRRVQRRAPRSRRRTPRPGCGHRRHRAPHENQPECRGRRRPPCASEARWPHSPECIASASLPAGPLAPAAGNNGPVRAAVSRL